MKFKHLIAPILFLMLPFCLKAQSQLKIGHVNVQELVQKHPSMDSIRAVMEKEKADMQEIYEEMVAEQESLLNAFEAESETWSDFIKTTKQNEILELSQKIEAYNRTAQEQLQRRNMELIQPVYRHINEEITNVAGHNHFTYVLDVSTGAVAYLSPESEDITPLVLERLKGE